VTPDGEDWAGREPDHAFGDVSEEGPGETSPPVSPDYDHVRPHLPGCARDLFVGRAIEQESGCPHSRLAGLMQASDELPLEPVDRSPCRLRAA
jgi:hypothetical protein